MKIYPINNTQFKTREIGTIENLVKKDKSVAIIPSEVEQKIIEFMQELAEKRIFEEFEATETAKRIILNV